MIETFITPMYPSTTMNQKLELIKQFKPIVFEKEVTLGDLFRDILVQKGISLTKFDKYSKVVTFSIDGEIPNIGGKPLSTAQALDTIVKPTQVVKILPRIAAG